MKFEKGRGLTASEQILADLCERSFLHLWTYPNLYTKANKELTDLMVVFGDDIILFSDKSCTYPDKGPADLDWKRWYKRSVTESVHQNKQAERSIRRQPDHVYLDVKATTPLPIPLPDMAQARFHHICVVTGANARCLAETGRETLSYDPNVVDDGRLFTVGRMTDSRVFVHIVDNLNLNLLLSELDTVSDFIGYLQAKEALLAGGHLTVSVQESDLLAIFLAHEHSFPAHTDDLARVGDLWARFTQVPQYAEGRRRDRVSRFWDNLINTVTRNYLNEELERGNELQVARYERLVRILAAESRFHRRILSTAILQRAERARVEPLSTLLPSDSHEVCYVTLIMQGAPAEAYAQYRQERMETLQMRCYAAKVVRPDVRYFIGIALDRSGVPASSEDFLYIDTDGWTPEQFAHGEAIRRDLGYFADNMVVRRHIDVEFPMPQ